MIKEIDKNNIPECVTVIKESFKTVADAFGFTPENAPGFTAFAIDEARLLQWMDEQHRHMYGYFEGDKLVGYYNLLILDNGECELGSLCVLPEYRHSCIGESLLNDALEKAKTLGCRVMHFRSCGRGRHAKGSEKRHKNAPSGKAHPIRRLPFLHLAVLRKADDRSLSYSFSLFIL